MTWTRRRQHHPRLHRPRGRPRLRRLLGADSDDDSAGTADRDVDAQQYVDSYEESAADQSASGTSGTASSPMPDRAGAAPTRSTTRRSSTTA